MSDSDGDRGEEEREPTDEECEEPEAPEELNEEPADTFTFDDELQEAFTGAPIARVMGEDGLPVPVVDDVLLDAHSPPFLPETNQICHELSEEYVLRDVDGDILARWDRGSVRRLPNGAAMASIQTATWIAPMLEAAVAGASDGERWEQLFSLLWRDAAEPAAKHNGMTLELHVAPLRPACKHLLLQLIPPPKSQAHILKQGAMNRYCTLRRSVAGAFMSLTEREMKACSARDPFDLESDEKLAYFDRTLATKSRNRTYHKMFNVKEDRESEDKPLSAFNDATQSMLENASAESEPQTSEEPKP